MNTHTIVQISLFSALAVILNIISIPFLPQGGGLEFYSLWLIFIALKYQPKMAIIVAIISQLITLLTGFAYVLLPMQWLLDYPLASIFLIIPFIFIKNKYVATIIGFTFKYITSVISGVIFFSEFSGNINNILYSMLYNGIYIIPNLILTLIILYSFSYFFKKNSL